MTGELEKTVRDYLKRIDAKDFAGVGQMLTDDVQSVDEISRRWLRGRQAVEEYFRQLGPAVEDVRSEIKDVREAVWGDSGMVTWRPRPRSSFAASDRSGRPPSITRCRSPRARSH